jgi:hypothetical protein
MGSLHILRHRASATTPRRKPLQAPPALRAFKRALAKTSEPALRANLARTITALEHKRAAT